MTVSAVIHPFPARMAPEIARQSIDTMAEGQRLLDPMCGSGTVIRAAVEHGVDAVGIDIDPLAVLMTRVWASKIDTVMLTKCADEVVARAKSYAKRPDLAWQDGETKTYIKYWFADLQCDQLSRLVVSILEAKKALREALQLALSKTIITKDKGASLARDVSHSRPHKSWDDNSFDVYKGFLRAVSTIAKRLQPSSIRGVALVERGDSRTLSDLPSDWFDCVLTSPPYLNAIDYMRGHRLSLVWLGYTLAQTTAVRSANVGSERGLQSDADVSPYLTPVQNWSLSERYIGWVRRYRSDADEVVREMARVLRPGGLSCLVVGNSYIRGWEVDNAQIFVDLLEDHNFRISSTLTRDIPSQSRYLPPPTAGSSSLAGRMRSEVVIAAHLSSRPL